MQEQKLQFLLNSFPELLRKTDENAERVFGKMNFIQMIEHMSDSIRIANGKFPHTTIVTPEDRIPAMQDFVRSDRDFKPNTKNILLGEDPEAVKSASKEAAIQELECELAAFVSHFKDQPGKVQRNPFFGDMDFGLWIDLLYKHAKHHLAQFNIQIPNS